MAFAIRMISLTFQIYQLLILLRVILSWVNVNPYSPVIDHPLVQLLHRITDPILEPLRRVIPPIMGAFDISPVVALILLEIVHRLVVSALLRL
jgi:YggT family protein